VPEGGQDVKFRSGFVQLSIVVFLLTSSRLIADLYDDYINSKSKSPFISFLARASDGSSGKPGHAFVALGVELDNGLRIYERVLGYYPKDESAIAEFKAVFSKTSGDLTQKIRDVTWTVEYRVPLDQAHRSAALKVVDKWLSTDPSYSLTASAGKNCNTFAAEIAIAAGLKAPGGVGITLPTTYIAKLKELNSN
jgi:hypothetical protein